MTELLIGLLTTVTGAWLAYSLGWYRGQRYEREIARMLRRERQGYDPYSDDPPVVEQEETA